MSFLISQGIEIKPALAEVLPDARKRITRYLSFRQNSEMPVQLSYAYGDTDPLGNAPTGWADLLLIDVRCETSQTNNAGGINEPMVVCVYEQISKSGLTQVGGLEIEELEDGRQATVLTYAQFSSVVYTPTAAGTSGTYGYLLTDKSEDNGSVRRIKKTYVTAGTLTDAEETKNGGALLIRTIVSAVTPVTTVTGYTRISISNKNPDGHDFYTEVFAKGAGQVSLQDDIKNNSALTIRTIQHITVPGTLGVHGTNPTAAQSGFTMIGESFRESDGHRIWTTSYAKGTGIISQDDSTKNDDKLLLRTVRYLDVPGTVGTKGANPTPAQTGYTIVDESYAEADGHRVWTTNYAKGAGEISRSVHWSQGATASSEAIGVTHTTIRELVALDAAMSPATLAGSVLVSHDVAEADGYRIWTTIWAKGAGLVAQSITARQDGLREVTNVALGTRSAPDGVVIRDDYRKENGYDLYTVSSMQAADAGAVTTGTVVFERYVPFTYPGRAKTFQETVNSYIMLDVFMSPPVTTDVNATVTVTYTTTNTLGTIANYWNPTAWATMRATWVGWGEKPYNQVTALTGYRSISATAIEVTATITGDGSDLSCLGNPVFGGKKANVKVTGGPADPGGSTFTLDATIEPAFTSTAGTVYYRKTIVTAAIPAQAALPV